MSRRLTELGVELAAAVDVDDESQHAMGAAGKSSALDAAERDLGADRRFSGLRGGRGAALSAGYDLGDPVIVNLRPEGLWILADAGRRRSGPIRPKKARRRGTRKPRGRPAVGDGGRFVAVGRYTPSRGLNTIDDAVDDMATSVPDALGELVDAKLRRL